MDPRSRPAVAAALVALAARGPSGGGAITFDCGPDPATIVLGSTAKVFNDRGTKLVIDGGDKVTLSGGGRTRLLYRATCDRAQVYPPGPGDCNTNPGVQLVVQNITFVDGNAKGIPEGAGNGGGGGAIHAQGGSLKVVHSRFFNNVCDELGSDVGGGAIRKLDDLVAPGASAIFFVGNDRSGSITIRDSITRNNPRGTFETPGLPGFYVLAKGPAQIIGSQIQR